MQKSKIFFKSPLHLSRVIMHFFFCIVFYIFVYVYSFVYKIVLILLISFSLTVYGGPFLTVWSIL